MNNKNTFFLNMLQLNSNILKLSYIKLFLLQSCFEVADDHETYGTDVALHLLNQSRNSALN
jgi:hypothetical protein